MLRTGLKKIIALMVVFVSAATAHAYASGTTEIIAGWERSADSRIMGDLALEGILSVEGNGMRINAFCARESFEALRSLRNQACGAIRDRLLSSRSFDAIQIWKAVLARTIRAGVASSGESEDLRTACTVPEIGGVSLSLAGRNPERADHDGAGVAMPAPAMPSSARIKLPVISGAPLVRSDGRAAIKINLTDRLLGSSKVDYFRLYLYLWEDIPDGDTKSVHVRAHAGVFPPLFFDLISSACLNQQQANISQNLKGPEPQRAGELVININPFRRKELI
jgi:hypothetical protein